nr:hypothetical protein [Bacteroidota bacterium]
MEKKRVIKSIENITEDVLMVIKKKYPDGWSNHVMRINKGNNEFFHAITVDTDDTSYMIKVNVKIDSIDDIEKYANQIEQTDVKEDKDLEESDDSGIDDDDA